jgi:lysophospholipase L1-like esterase
MRTPFLGSSVNPPSVAFVGDSITVGSGSTGSGLGGYRRRVIENLASDGYSDRLLCLGEQRDSNFNNSDHSGVSGNTTAQMTTRVAANFGAGKRQPDAFFVLAGANNAASDPARTAFTTDYPLLLDALHAANPSAKIIVSTITDSSDAGYAPRIDSMNAEIASLWDAWEAANPSAPALVRLDLRSVLGDWAAGNFADFIHPNNTGYATIGDAIDTAVRAALGIPS